MYNETVEIVIVDEIRCIIKGLHKKSLDQLSAKFSYFVEGYRWTAAYKVGAWDGKKSFIDYKGGGAWPDLTRVRDRCYGVSHDST